MTSSFFQAYQNAKQNLEFDQINGEAMVKKMAETLGRIFEKKLRALQVSKFTFVLSF